MYLIFALVDGEKIIYNIFSRCNRATVYNISSLTAITEENGGETLRNNMYHYL